MMNFFGKKKKAASTTSQGAVVGVSGGGAGAAHTVIKLRDAVQNQEKREEHLQRKIDAMGIEAKAKMAKKDKKGAMFAMKRRKLYEAEMDKIGNVKMTLETQMMQLESASQNAETFQAMKAGTSAMSKIHEQVGIDKVDDLMDDIREEIENGNEINQAMAQAVDPLCTDEDELLAELEALGADDLEAELLEPVTVPQLPSVPNSKLPSLNNAEAAEMKKLEAELAGL